MAEACKSCRFLEPDGREKYPDAGYCRRFPPQINILADPRGGSFFEPHWPWMNGTEWCGEYALQYRKNAR